MEQIIDIVMKLKLEKLHLIKSLKHGTKYISWVADKNDDYMLVVKDIMPCIDYNLYLYHLYEQSIQC